MRARYPDIEGFVERDGVKIGYEVYGTREPTILLLPIWAIAHTRVWKAQIPFLARHFRVVVAGGRGNGRSDRPDRPDAYTDQEYVADALAVLDDAGSDAVVAVGLSSGGRWALELAAWHPERVLGVVAIGPALPKPWPADFDEVRAEYVGAQKFNRHCWRQDYPGFAQWYLAACFGEPHSTKQIEDGVGYAMETSAQTLIHTADAPGRPTAADAEEICRAVTCPVLVVHGDDDAIVPYETGVAIARWTGGRLVTGLGGCHVLNGRRPVQINLLVGEFAARFAPPPAPQRWSRPVNRPRRVLFVCSPIGLGHVRRDLAIAAALRAERPGVEIDWLAQSPVAEMVVERGERVHPASRWLASESGHLESEAGEHDLRVFEAFRRMDEIMVANFMVFHDALREAPYDLCVADEGWEVDHFLHENPELKHTAYAWLTDVVGWLPMPDGGDAEAALTADYNAEMLELIARLPRIRDRAIFVGDPEDVVPDAFGPGLPSIRDWTAAHYEFAGYVTGFTPPEDRAALRAELGYRPDERVCVVTVGGTGVGAHLLRRVVAAYPAAARAVPGLRMVAVAGPRIDAASITAPAGVEVVGYLPDLHRHLAACDIAVVQGGLTTTMELTAARRPFVYVPVGNHFEQNIHVRHRLARHGAGRCMQYTETEPEQLAAAIAEQIERPVGYLPVPADGAARAAALLAELI